MRSQLCVTWLVEPLMGVLILCTGVYNYISTVHLCVRIAYLSVCIILCTCVCTYCVAVCTSIVYLFVYKYCVYIGIVYLCVYKHCVLVCMCQATSPAPGRCCWSTSRRRRCAATRRCRWRPSRVSRRSCRSTATPRTALTTLTSPSPCSGPRLWRKCKGEGCVVRPLTSATLCTFLSGLLTELF